MTKEKRMFNDTYNYVVWVGANIARTYVSQARQ